MDQQHEELLERWSKRYEGKPFVKDGIIDKTRWSAAKPKVLFLLKEAYGNQNWDLRQELRSAGPNHTIWRNVARWSYAAHYAMQAALATMPIDFAIPSELFLSSAVANVKKADGQRPSVDEDIALNIRRDGHLLREQIKLIQPDIVICCGRVIWKTFSSFLPDVRQVYDLVWQSEEQLFVDYWHPANQFPAEMHYYALGCLLQNAAVRVPTAVAA